MTKQTINAKYIPGWLSWVSATTGCLDYLGAKRDSVDVAGYSGYAFLICIHKELCPSGPTVFDWNKLQTGNSLGRSNSVFISPCLKDENDVLFRELYEFVKRETDSGRPCVIWGAYLPEFAIVTKAENDEYTVSSCYSLSNQPEPVIKYNELQTMGITYAIAFPNDIDIDQKNTDKWALYHAVEMMNLPAFGFDYTYGIKAYDAWIKALENKNFGKGASYNAQCWSEARCKAASFITRLAERYPKVKSLDKAAKAFADTTKNLKTVAELFPFPGSTEPSEADVAKAISSLKKAKSAETKALKAMQQALEEF